MVHCTQCGSSSNNINWNRAKPMKAKYICISETKTVEKIKIPNTKSMVKPQDHIVHIQHNDYDTFMRIWYKDLKEIYAKASKEIRRKKYENL